MHSAGRSAVDHLRSSLDTWWTKSVPGESLALDPLRRSREKSGGQKVYLEGFPTADQQILCAGQQRHLADAKITKSGKSIRNQLLDKYLKSVA